MPTAPGLTEWIIIAGMVAGFVLWRMRVARDERAAQRRTAGRCARCDYDLADVASGECPGCQTAIIQARPGDRPQLLTRTELIVVLSAAAVVMMYVLVGAFYFLSRHPS